MNWNEDHRIIQICIDLQIIYEMLEIKSFFINLIFFILQKPILYINFCLFEIFAIKSADIWRKLWQNDFDHN